MDSFELKTKNLIQEQSEYDAFIFIHLPKCGGSSFRSFVNKCALNSGINTENIYIPGSNGLSVNKNLSQLSDLEIKEFDEMELKVIACHMTIKDLDHIKIKFKNPFVYTILRDPVERFISHYNFFNYTQGNQNCKGILLNELSDDKFEEILNRLSNIQLNMLSMIKFPKIFEPDNIIKIAKYNLLFEIHDFGLISDIETSLINLSKKGPKWLNIDVNLFPQINASEAEIFNNIRIIDLIAANHKSEIDFYKFAKKVFYS